MFVREVTEFQNKPHKQVSPIMKNFLLAFSICIAWSFFALWLYSWLLPNDVKTVAVSDFPKLTSEKNTPISSEILNTTPVSENLEKNNELFSDEDDILRDKTKVIKINIFGLSAINADKDIVFRFEEGISFIKDSKSLIIPKSLIDFKYKINTYLIEHPKTEVHIISKYSAIENFETPNIGIQRGNEIKNLLTTLGIDSTRVIVKSSIEEIKFSTDNSYSNAIGFEFKHLNEDHIALVTPEITAIPEVITFYPRISDSGILKSKKLDELVETVINIFEEDPTIKITIVGHTDNSGTANENYNRGLNYAKDVRWYLVTKGKIDRLKIKVSSKGDVEPLRSNRTRNGRSANKRVELLIE